MRATIPSRSRIRLACGHERSEEGSEDTWRRRLADGSSFCEICWAWKTVVSIGREKV